MKEKAFCHENGRRFFRAMRDAGADGAHEGSINKNLKFDKNRQKITNGCGMVKKADEIVENIGNGMIYDEYAWNSGDRA